MGCACGGGFGDARTASGVVQSMRSYAYTHTRVGCASLSSAQCTRVLCLYGSASLRTTRTRDYRTTYVPSIPCTSRPHHPSFLQPPPLHHCAHTHTRCQHPPSRPSERTGLVISPVHNAHSLSHQCALYVHAHGPFQPIEYSHFCTPTNVSAQNSAERTRLPNSCVRRLVAARKT